MKLGVRGKSILRRESFSKMKCFHAGGAAKWWLASAHESGIPDYGETLDDPTDFIPYEEFVPTKFYFLQKRRKLLRGIGYYSIFGSS